MCEIDWSAIAIVIATVAGPILAVWASEVRQRRRQDRDRKEWVFRTLYTTRSSRLQPEHISALNHIDFAFPQKSYPAIADAWGLYLDHLNSSQGTTQESMDRWNDTAYNLLVDLIHLMANDLNIPFSKTSIKKYAYYPKGYAFTEYQQNELRTLLLELLKNERTVRISTSITPGPHEEDIKAFVFMQQLWRRFLAGETPIPVHVKKDPDE